MKNFDKILEEDLFNLFIIYNLNHKCNYFIKMNTLFPYIFDIILISKLSYLKVYTV